MQDGLVGDRRDGQAGGVEAGQAGVDDDLGATGVLGPDQAGEQRRGDVAGADDDAVGRRASTDRRERRRARRATGRRGRRPRPRSTEPMMPTTWVPVSGWTSAMRTSSIARSSVPMTIVVRTMRPWRRLTASHERSSERHSTRKTNARTAAAVIQRRRRAGPRKRSMMRTPPRMKALAWAMPASSTQRTAILWAFHRPCVRRRQEADGGGGERCRGPRRRGPRRRRP